MSLVQSIKDTTAAARKVHGSDIFIMVARAINFGNDDNLVIVQGKNHVAAARDFAKVLKGVTFATEYKGLWDENDNPIEGRGEAYTTIQWF